MNLCESTTTTFDNSFHVPKALEKSSSCDGGVSGGLMLLAPRTFFSRAIPQLIMPRDGSPYPLDDVSASVLVRFVAHTGANPYVVRHIILMLTEIANTPSKVKKGDPSRGAHGNSYS